MSRSPQQRRARLKLILLIAAGIVVFAALQSPALLHRHPPGYEEKPPPGQFHGLNWSELQRANWVYGQTPMLPEGLLDLDGKPVTARGFLLPLHSPGRASQFFMSDKPGGCYFCSPPGVSSVIQLNLAGGKKLDMCTATVDVYGTFHVATGAPTDRVLYWIDDAVLVAF